MKKILAMLLALTCLFVFAACANDPVTDETEADTEVSTEAATEEATEEATEAATEAPVDDPAVKSEGVMTYAEYAAAALDSEVTIEAYVQAKQGWWEKEGQGVATIYTQDTEGAYFLYEMPISEEDYNKLVDGAKIRVKGYKAEWMGEVEIIDATYEILEGNYVAEALDVTAKLGTDELIANQNMFVAFKGMTVAASTDANGNEAAFLYNWDGSGSQGNDLYFNVAIGDQVYNFTVESYLCGADTDVYKAVEALNIGDVIDMEGFLYWYDGVNPHITSVTVVTAE
ncbi:MAG: hypothetical protein E7658_06085 [Ruminococcaceae bacterium]|nr:hypothetical protein [Oscillospiraceae bacterium]